MPLIAKRKSKRIRADRLECLIKFGVKAFRCRDTSFRIPSESFRVFRFRDGCDLEPIHPGQPCDAPALEPRAMAKGSSDQHQSLQIGVQSRKSTLRWVPAIDLAELCPRELAQVELDRAAQATPQHQTRRQMSAWEFSSLPILSEGAFSRQNSCSDLNIEMQRNQSHVAVHQKFVLTHPVAEIAERFAIVPAFLE